MSRLKGRLLLEQYVEADMGICLHTHTGITHGATFVSMCCSIKKKKGRSRKGVLYITLVDKPPYVIHASFPLGTSQISYKYISSET